jgi:hypothetical protein
MHQLSKGLRAAAVLGTGSLILSGCAFLGRGDAKRDDSGRPTESAVADVFKVKIGDCISEPRASEARTTELRNVTIIPCDQDHDWETFAATMATESTYPGSDVMESRAEDFCFVEFATFVGMDYQESVLDVFLFYPSSETWRGGDREIMCLVGEPQGSTTIGTLKSAAR